MKVLLGADIAGFSLKQEVKEHLAKVDLDILDIGMFNTKDQIPYYEIAARAARKLQSKEADRAILFCGTGMGVAIVANKFPGVRAAMCYDTFSAEISKLANNANVLVLSIRYTGERLGREIVDKWLETAPSTEPRRVNFHRKTDELDARTRTHASRLV